MDVSYKTEQPMVENKVESVHAVSLSSIVKKEVNRLLGELSDDDAAANLYERVIGQMDAGIIEALIEHTKNNQSLATRILGLARGTVRKKWSIYTKAKQEEKKKEQL